MATGSPERIISIIDPQLYQPIADLVARLLARPYRQPDRVGSNYYEAGYSAAAILLLAAVIESLVQRDRYFFLKAYPKAKQSTSVTDYLKTTLRYRRHVQVKELFDVRNSVAHNHVWEIEFTTPPEGGRRHRGSAIVAGTHRLASLPPRNAKVPRTKVLRLNLQPSRLDRTDLGKVLSAGLHLLDFLSRKGHTSITTTRQTVGFQGRNVAFAELVTLVRNAL